MVKNSKYFWTPTKTIVTILILIMFGFILFKLGVFDFMNFDRFLTASTDPGSSPISSIVNHGGGTK